MLRCSNATAPEEAISITSTPALWKSLEKILAQGDATNARWLSRLHCSADISTPTVYVFTVVARLVTLNTSMKSVQKYFSSCMLLTAPGQGNP